MKLQQTKTVAVEDDVIDFFWSLLPRQHDNSIIHMNSTKKGKVSEYVRVCGGDWVFLGVCVG